ncbi:MAG TPA: 30S ribosomal protein S20 [Candidatus Paceibacterota bacterium]|jgi:small subunit ribosomal protein S20|nr:30S ribosomal protein S20 [Candidatus Paceibacterota bacterium]
MPITKSAKKALRQSEKRRLINKKNNKIVKAEIKKLQKLIDSNKINEAKEQLKIVYKKLDKAAKTNLIKDNKASRLKSRLTKKLNLKSKNA